ncbi:MAG: RT0821/Lpp0805 family surface protein [Acetobacteraceae bacterium]
MGARLGILPVCFLLAAAIAPAARAQQFPPFGSRLGPGLKGDDLAIVTDATGAMNAAGSRGSRHWSNPKTGTSGTITLVRDFRSAGMACHEFRYLLRFTHPTRHQTYTLDWCRTADGEWKIKS